MAIYGCKKTDNNTATSSSITVSVTVEDAVTSLKIPYVSMERITQSNFATYQGYFGTTDSLGQFKFSESYGSRISFNKTGYYGQTWLVDYGNNPTVWNVKLKPMKKINVSGFVLDSLTNKPIDSVRIGIGGSDPRWGGVIAIGLLILQRMEVLNVLFMLTISTLIEYTQEINMVIIRLGLI